MKKLSIYLLSGILSTILLIQACSKSPTTTPPAPTNPCASKTIVVSGPTTSTASPTTSTGSISASATGSTGFTFSLNGGASQPTGSFTGLVQGTYSVTAKDADGCTGAQSFVVTATACPTITVTAVVTAASSGTAANGTIVATATGSTGITYSILAAGVQGPFQASGTFSNLVAASYNITARDANGCTGSASFTVTTAACPTITLAAITPTNTTGPTIANGSFTVSVASGGLAPFTFSRDNGATFQPSGAFTNLAANTYGVVAKDANGCSSNSVNVTVGVTCPTITATAVPTTTVKCESNTGTVTINASGSTGLNYSLNGGAFQASNLFGTLAVGTYPFTVRDVNGCTITGSTSVAQAAAGTLFTSVKAIMVANCVSAGCHNATTMQSGYNFNDDCTIVSAKARIKARAVDASPSQMPAAGPGLSASDKAAITNWINAGGRHNN